MSDPRLDTFDADIKAIAARFDTLRSERDTARDLAARLTEEVIEMRHDKNHPFRGVTTEFISMECDDCANIGTAICERCCDEVENTRRPTDDSVRLEQVAAILRRFVDRHSESVEYPPPPPLSPSLLRALAIAERTDA